MFTVENPTEIIFASADKSPTSEQQDIIPETQDANQQLQPGCSHDIPQVNPPHEETVERGRQQHRCTGRPKKGRKRNYEG